MVIVNQAMADMVFPQDPIGKRINFTYTNEPNYVQIVGVVGNENVDSLDAPPTPIVYGCFEQDPIHISAWWSARRESRVPLWSQLRGPFTSSNPRRPCSK